VAGLSGLELDMAEARGGQLVGQVLGLVAGKAMGGVPARSRFGGPLGQRLLAAWGKHPPGLAEPGGAVVLVVCGTDRLGHCRLAVG
jgi:hypothetical protein